jgi:hypothetical protein
MNSADQSDDPPDERAGDVPGLASHGIEELIIGAAVHADARGPELTGGGAASPRQENAQEKIVESGGRSRIQWGGQGGSPSQSLGGQANRVHLRAAFVRLQPSNNRKRVGKAKVDSSDRSSDNGRIS